MKILKSLITLTLTLSLLASCAKRVQNTNGSVETGRSIYLFAGFDDAAENTDVLFLLSFDRDEKQASVLQIPRDTYVNFGKSQNKINQIFSSARSEGKTATEAMSILKSKISDIFGVCIDGYIALTTAAFRDIVDALGGVEVALPSDFVLKDEDGKGEITLSAGVHLLNGEMAERFVRYRKGYVMGDVGRMDAQKLFLNALVNRLGKGAGIQEAVAILGAMWREVKTDLSVADVIEFAAKNSAVIRESRIRYATLPGEAVAAPSGVWYYVANKKSAQELAKDYLFSKSEFDKAGALYDPSNLAFENVYRDGGITYKEYTGQTLSDLYILGQK